MQLDSSDPHNSGPAPRMSQEARVAPSDANAKYIYSGVFALLFLFLKLFFRRSSRLKYPIRKWVDFQLFSPSHKAFLTSLFSDHEPTSYEEAITQSCWKDAMQEEISALEQNSSWELVDLPRVEAK